MKNYGDRIGYRFHKRKEGMRIISANVNGIRSAAKKGFFDWLETQQADVVCLQETKAQMRVLEEVLYRPNNYYCYFHDALKPGYSGVGIYCKKKPERVIMGLGFSSADDEGRYIQADFGHCSVVSLYMPSGSSGDARQAIKFDFMKHYQPILKAQINSSRDFIICGDWNIVHKEIDIKNFKSNQKSSGCLSEERAWLDDVFVTLGFIDAFREVNQAPNQYTWWSNRGQAWEKNVGWRIDYQIVTPGFKGKIKKESIYKDQRFSDHAPLVMDYDYEL